MTGQDLVLAGAGLANGLIAYRLATKRPDLRVTLVETAPEPGGNHTWSFHEADLTDAQADWLDPFVVHRWPAYDVRFPGRNRRVRLGYRSVTSERFAAVLRAKLGPSLRCGEAVERVEPERVVLASGETLTAAAVIDGRGFRPGPNLDLAYQLFLGRELQLDAPHGIDLPVLMDATVAQHGGYRFVYVLPLSPDRLLVEDTYYADEPTLDAETLRGRIDAYAAAMGWQVRAVLREERGVLPITLDGRIEAFWREAGRDVAVSGLRAGLFHPTTGYSLPDAVRLADHLAGLPDLSGPAIAQAIQSRAVDLWRSQGFYRLLNRLLFHAGPSAERFRMLGRFYGMRDPLIARFYAGRLRISDKARILSGWPPVPLLGAIRVLLSRPRSRAA